MYGVNNYLYFAFSSTSTGSNEGENEERERMIDNEPEESESEGTDSDTSTNDDADGKEAKNLNSSHDQSKPKALSPDEDCNISKMSAYNIGDSIEDDTSEEDSEEENEEVSDADDESCSSEAPENEESPLNGKELPATQNKETDEKSGWADAMAKVLNMGKNTLQTNPNKPLFLSKAIKDSEIKQRSLNDSAVGDKDSNETPAETRPKLKASIRHAQKKELEEKGRCKPDITKDRAREKILCKLATKGVVQLFNAVREQQKSIKTQLNVAGGSVRKREKIYQNMDRQSFLNVLTNQKSVQKKAVDTNISVTQTPNSLDTKFSSKRPKLTTNRDIDGGVKEESDAENDSVHESTWNVFRDDFMMGAKMKDWDKKESDSD